LILLFIKSRFLASMVYGAFYQKEFLDLNNLYNYNFNFTELQLYTLVYFVNTLRNMLRFLTEVFLYTVLSFEIILFNLISLLFKAIRMFLKIKVCFVKHFHFSMLRRDIIHARARDDISIPSLY
ncbi:hypothetical protein L9F63_002420, partial [Diploptera punctata]